MITSDRPERWQVSEHRVLATGRVSSFIEDDIITPSGEKITRQYVTHPGAVAIVAWDEDDQIVVVDQYRHPVAHRLVEVPAGLLDHPDEDPLVAAARELAEEVELAADHWQVLIDVFNTPGGCAEGIRIYLARGLKPVPRPEGFVIEGEEAHMQCYRLRREQLLDAIYAGQVSNPSLVGGLLALESARLGGRLESLRPADCPWPARNELFDRL